MTVPLGSRSLCLFWDYQGVPANSPTAARLFFNSVLDTDNSVFDATVTDPEGTFWACFDNPSGWLPGMYEVEWWVNDEFVFSEQVFVGDNIELIEVSVINDSPLDLCQVRFAPAGANSFGLDDLGRVLRPGETGSIILPLGRYVVSVLDCNGSVRFEDRNGTDLFNEIPLTIT